MGQASHQTRKKKEMTKSQTMRLERRAARVAQERKHAFDMAVGIATLLFILLAFALAGTSDFQNEQRELAYWESQGVTITRW